MLLSQLMSQKVIRSNFNGRKSPSPSSERKESKNRKEHIETLKKMPINEKISYVAKNVNYMSQIGNGQKKLNTDIPDSSGRSTAISSQHQILQASSRFSNTTSPKFISQISSTSNQGIKPPKSPSHYILQKKLA